MHLKTYPNAEAFLEAARLKLESNESLYGLILGIAESLTQGDTSYDQAPYLAVVFDQDEVVLTALMTPPHKLLLAAFTPHHRPATEILAQDLRGGKHSFPGLLAETKLAHDFAQTWSLLMGSTFQQQRSERTYELHKVTTSFYPKGNFRQATPQDREQICRYAGAFQIEIDENHQGVPVMIDLKLKRGEIYLWENNDICAIASYTRPTRNGIAIQLVYTPPEKRRRGYASALVAALSQQALDQGKTFVTLNTDLDNPTSNKIYQAIGFFPVGDTVSLGLSKPSVNWSIPIDQVNAFTAEGMLGNPAAVCPLEAWLPDEVLQGIAAENNLSETSFLVPHDGEADFEIRWFTPTVEVDLCGHATLASAFALCSHRDWESNTITFNTQCKGKLTVTRHDDLYELNFPATKVKNIDEPHGLSEAMGASLLEIHRADQDLLLLVDNESVLRELKPVLKTLKEQGGRGIIVTAPGDKVDFVSRFFAPAAGIDEDPVTGSAHCALAPFWADRLGKTKLLAHQISKRGGEILCRLEGDRVFLSGKGKHFMTGWINP